MTQTALVTVGTTEFDDLIRGIDSTAVLRQLVKHGYHRLVVQHGNGRYKIRVICEQPVDGIHVELHEYLPKLTDVIEGCDLVISHCGAGSVFEALSLPAGLQRRALIVVPNPALMDNHQAELAELLEARQWAIQSTPNDLEDAIQKAILGRDRLKAYEPGSASGIASTIDSLFSQTYVKRTVS